MILSLVSSTTVTLSLQVSDQTAAADSESPLRSGETTSVQFPDLRTGFLFVKELTKNTAAGL